MEPLWRLGRRDVAALAGLLAVTAVIYHKALLFGAVYFDSDIAWYYGPVYQYTADRLAHGELPYWNPYLYGGTPFLVSPQTGTFYPPAWIGMFMPIQYAVTLMVVGHLVLAGIFTYVFCRGALRVGALPAFCAALGFAQGGFLPAHFLQPAHVMSAAWMPGVLWAYLRGCTSGRRGWFVAAAVMLGMSLLAGGGQNVYLICFALVVACGYECAVTRRLLPLQGLVITALFSAAVGAAQLVPTARFIAQSSRAGGYAVERIARGSAEPVESLVAMVCPHFFGHEGTIYWGSSYLGNITSYLGVSTLLLGVGAALLCWRQRPVVYLVVLAFVSLIMAWGVHTPIFPVAIRFVPGMSYFNSHGRFLQCFCFALAGLAAVGFEHLLRGVQARAWHRYLGFAVLAWILLGIAAVLVLTRQDPAGTLAHLRMPSGEGAESLRAKIDSIAGPGRSVQEHYARLFGWTLLVWGAAIGLISRICRGRRGRKLAVAMVPVLLAVDLIMFNRGMLPWAQAGTGRHYLQSRPWIEFLQQQGERTRWRAGAYWPPNTPALYRIRTTDNYASFLPQSRHGALVIRRNLLGAEHRWNELFAVHYGVALADDAPADAVLYRFANAPLVVYRIAQPLERVRLVGRAEIATTAAQALDRVYDPEFHSRTSVVLEDAPPLSASSLGAPVGHAVSIIRDEPERLTVQVETSKEAYLVVSDAYFPGWRAWCNGVATPVWRANYYFRAVRVPAGTSRVELRFVDHSIWLGTATTLLSLAAALAWACMAWLRHER